MIVTPQSVAALQTTFKALYKAAYNNAKPCYEDVATIIPSGSRSNTYGWLGQFPDFREWIGDRELKDLTSYGYKIENKHWESSVTVPRNDIEDDNIGVYAPIFKEMGRAARVFPDRLVFDLLNKGFDSECYDGQYFFDTDHPVGDDVVSNMQEGTGQPWFLLDTTREVKPLIYQDRQKPDFVSKDQSNADNVFIRNEYNYGVDLRSNVGFSLWQLAFGSKAELNEDNFNNAYAAMTSVRSPEGRPLGITPSLLVVPPQLRIQAFRIAKAGRMANGADNVNKDLVDVMVCPWLA